MCVYFHRFFQDKKGIEPLDVIKHRWLSRSTSLTNRQAYPNIIGDFKSTYWEVSASNHFLIHHPTCRLKKYSQLLLFHNIFTFRNCDLIRIYRLLKVIPIWPYIVFPNVKVLKSLLLTRFIFNDLNHNSSTVLFSAVNNKQYPLIFFTSRVEDKAIAHWEYRIRTCDIMINSHAFYHWTNSQ